MELLWFGAGAVVGLAVGVVLARFQDRSNTVDTRSSAPPDLAGPTLQPRNRRQRKILASLPPDPPRKTIEDLIAEEASELGIDGIASDDGIPIAVKLRVFRRDRPGLPDDADTWRFVVIGSDRTDYEDVELTHIEQSDPT